MSVLLLNDCHRQNGSSSYWNGPACHWVWSSRWHRIICGVIKLQLCLGQNQFWWSELFNGPESSPFILDLCSKATCANCNRMCKQDSEDTSCAADSACQMDQYFFTKKLLLPSATSAFPDSENVFFQKHLLRKIPFKRQVCIKVKKYLMPKSENTFFIKKVSLNGWPPVWLVWIQPNN